MNEEYSDMFSELSGHSGGNKYKSMAHVLFSFAGWTYEKWMDQQYTDLSMTPAFLDYTLSSVRRSVVDAFVYILFVLL